MEIEKEPESQRRPIRDGRFQSPEDIALQKLTDLLLIGAIMLMLILAVYWYAQGGA